MVLVFVSVIDAVLELVFYRYLNEGPAMIRKQLLSPAGICVKDGMGLLTGILAFFLYRHENLARPVVRVMFVLLLAELTAVLFTIRGSIVNRVDGVISATLVLTIMVVYTGLQMERSDLNWQKIRKAAPSALDLKLQDVRQWFNPLQIGPKLALNKEIDFVVDRYLKAAKEQRPLEINIRCPEEISEPMQATMQETFRMFYEDEQQQVNHYLERRYIRVMALLTISVIGVTVWINLSPSDNESVIWTILSNFSAFSLWQIGYTYFERAEGYGQLLRAQIAGQAKLRFWSA